MATLQTFLTDIYGAVGGLAEVADHVLEAVADSHCGLSESVRLWVGDAQPPAGVEPLHLGHAALERALEVARSDGFTAARHLVPNQARRSGLEGLISKTFGFRNARPSFGLERLAAVPVSLFHYRVTSVWDERREELLRIPVDTQNGMSFDASLLDRAFLEPGPAFGAERGGIDAAWKVARERLPRLVAPRLAVYEREAARHLDVERSRLEEYFQSQIRDLDRRLAGAGVDAARRAALTAKRESVMRDLETRRRDLEDKFRIRVSARLCCVELVDIPRVLVPLSLKGRRADRDLVCSYNFLTHALDPIPCEGCAEAVSAIYLCAAGHIGCPRCAVECSGCRRISCAACGAVKCGVCEAPTCAGCDRACDTCGKVTCERHRGACHAVASPTPPKPTQGRPVVATPPPKPSSNGRPVFRASTAQPPRPSSPAPGTTSKPGSLTGWSMPSKALLLSAFADYIAESVGLEEALHPIAALVAAGRIKRAAAALNELRGCLPPTMKPLRERFAQVHGCLTGNPGLFVSRLQKIAQEAARRLDDGSPPDDATRRRSDPAPRQPAWSQGFMVPPGAPEPQRTPSQSASGSCVHAPSSARHVAPGPRTQSLVNSLLHVLPGRKAPEELIQKAAALALRVSPLIDESEAQIEGWAAAIAYLLPRLDPTIRHIRQSDAAAWFGVSGTTVSKRVYDIERALVPQH